MFRTEYIVEKAFWGDQYRVDVYETHKNMPGFAPEDFEVKVCEIWTKYSDWERRIEFSECKLVYPETLKEITRIFKSKLETKKYGPKVDK